VACADVGGVLINNTSLNHYLSTPNKLFECLAAGVPVVASDFPAIRDVVIGSGEPLGIVVDPDDAAAVAAGLRTLLQMPAAERESLRARCLAAARELWNWETESGRLVALYGELVGGSSPTK
jgi:glycosyltransferase involved in cell wall biosynthesis